MDKEIQKTPSKRVLILIAIGVFAVILSTIIKQAENSKYQSVNSISISNLMVEKYSIDRGIAYLILKKNGNNLCVKVANSDNDALVPNSFCRFVRKGDYISKSKNSKYLTVCRRGVQYRFKIGDLYFNEKPTKCN
jgi:hypothetical protein